MALANPANYPMTDTSPNTLYGFAFHSHALGTTTALLPSHEPREPETASEGRRGADRFGCALWVALTLPARARDDVGLHRSG